MTSRSTHGYIGPNLVVHGRLSGKGLMSVDGRLEGDVEMQGELNIGNHGTVIAAVSADVVQVAGRLRGNVRASSEVLVREGGLIEGDVSAPRVGIDDGGGLHGGIQMDFELPEDVLEGGA